MRWRDRREPMNTVLLYTLMAVGAFFLLVGVWLGAASFLAYLGGK